MSSVNEMLNNCNKTNFEEFVNKLYVVKRAGKAILKVLGCPDTDTISLDMVKEKFKTLGMQSTQILRKLQRFASSYHSPVVEQTERQGRVIIPRKKDETDVEEENITITVEMIENCTPQKAPQIAAQLKSSAESGDATSMWLYGYCLYKGKGVFRNTEEAVVWFRNSAHLGNPYGEWALGECYDFGQGVFLDLDQSDVHYKAAAAKFRALAVSGDANAQARYAHALNNGLGVRKSQKQALFWYRKSAEQGNFFAQKYLAKNLTDPKEQFLWQRHVQDQEKRKNTLKLEQRANEGDGEAMLQLEAYYRSNNDLAKCNYWLRKAADRGEPDAFSRLEANSRPSAKKED